MSRVQGKLPVLRLTLPLMRHLLIVQGVLCQGLRLDDSEWQKALPLVPDKGNYLKFIPALDNKTKMVNA